MGDSLFYDGPQCPHCGTTFSPAMYRNGEVACESCGRTFEATVFEPPERKVSVAAAGTVGPEGGTACANHPGNAAVTSCQRCGLLICALCDMNVGAGSFCPSCFDRVRADGTLKPIVNTYRDYGSLAHLAALGGLLMFCAAPALGPLAIYYARKAIKVRRELGRSTASMIVVIVLGVLELLGALAMAGFLIWAIITRAK